LIYNTAWKTLIYVLAALLVRYFEHVIPLVMQQKHFLEAHRLLIDKIIWPHFWLVQMWLLVLFFVYCAMRELVRTIGREQVTRLFLGGNSKSTA
jgi:hypothetical protein